MTSEHPHRDDRPPPATRPPQPTTDPGTGAAPVVALGERRLHPAYLLIGIAKLGRALFPVIVALTVALSSRISLPVAVALVVVVLVTALALTAGEWHRTRYAVVDGALHLRRGLLHRSERAIPVSRISALDTNRGLVQRIFGLVSVEVQTAGGDKKAEIKLETVTVADAERLRAVLGHAAPVAGRASNDDPDQDAGARPAIAAGRESPASTAPVDGTVVYAITPRELVVAALTGPQLGIVVVAVGALFSQVRDYLPDGLTRRAESTVSSAEATTIVVLVALALLVAAVVAVTGTVLAFTGFTVTREQQRLRIRRGLLVTLIARWR